jgi:hypothetical protein
MVCDTQLKPRQTLAERKAEVRKRMSSIDKLIANRTVQLRVGPQGAVTFTGLTDSDRDGLTDACIYRTVTRTGSAAAKLAIQRAEQLSSRPVDRRMLAAGVHSHDGGKTWSTH